MLRLEILVDSFSFFSGTQGIRNVFSGRCSPHGHFLSPEHVCSLSMFALCEQGARDAAITFFVMLPFMLFVTL